MKGEITAYCVLGSNQGDRAGFLRRAVFGLADTDGVEVLAASRIWETAPWGRTDQADFLNAAVQLRTRLDAESLLDRFHAIEHRLGRRRDDEEGRWGPRPIDLDLALYGDEVIASSRLAVPHPRLSQRAFALAPLVEIAPDARDPRTGKPYAQVLESLDRTEGGAPGSAGRVTSLLLRSCGEPLESLLDELRSGETLLLTSGGVEETERLASMLGGEAGGGEVVALVGRLGAGKTCFARGFARGLGIEEPVTSPSYVLIKSYEGRLVLHHADFYRLASQSGAPPPAPPEGGGGGSDRRDARPARSLPHRQASLAGDRRDACPTTDEAGLASLGLEDYLEDPRAVVLIEWADRFPRWLEPPFRMVEIAGSGGGTRFLLLTKYLEVRP